MADVTTLMEEEVAAAILAETEMIEEVDMAVVPTIQEQTKATPQASQHPTITDTLPSKNFNKNSTITIPV